MKAGEITSWAGIVLAIAIGCGAVGGAKTQGTIAANDYVNPEQGFAFRIPPGWSHVKEGGFFGRPEHLVRFGSPGGDAAVIAHVAPVGGFACFDAAKNLLATRDGMRIVSEEPFNLTIPGGSLPAWRADLVAAAGDRRGRSAFFCDGGRLVVLEGSATNAAWPQRQAEIAVAIRSFAYTAGTTIVRVEPPAPTPTPERFFSHLIEWRGQNLAAIAKWYTGKAENWRTLAELNGVKSAKEFLPVGREVRIPQALVVKTAPLPRPRVRPAQVAPSPAAEAPADEDLPPVIGPK